MTESLPLDGRSLTLEQFLAVVRAGCPVSLEPSARTAMEQSRASVARAVADGRTVYGVTTGFGALSTQPIDPAEGRALQRTLIESHATGVGPPLALELVRGLLLLRANSLARGASGVRPVIVERLVEYLNRRLAPWVPEAGSVGASGDLAPLAHVAATLLGQGAFRGADGRPEPAAAVLAREGLAPIELEAKEGLSLINGTSLMGAYLALGVAELETLLRTAEVSAALSADALEASLEPMDDRLGELRNAPDERAVAAAIRSLRAGTELVPPADRWVGQDPYTVRCVPQVLGAVRRTARFAREVAEAELNAVTDNPIVVEGERFLHGGNFHGQPLALALDALAIAAHTLGAFSERRIARLVDPALSRGLPPFLADRPGLSSGFMIPQTVAAALVAENATLAHPASAYSLPTSASQEDFVSMGAWAGAKLSRLLTNVRRIVAIELLAGARGLFLRRPRKGGLGSEAAARYLASAVAPRPPDGVGTSAVEELAEQISRGMPVSEVASTVPF